MGARAAGPLGKGCGRAARAPNISVSTPPDPSLRLSLLSLPGSLGLAIMGGAGMLSVSIVLPVIGRFYDRGIAERLAGRTAAALPAPEFASVQAAAGLETLGRMAVLPAILAVVFLLLWLTRKKAAAAAG